MIRHARADAPGLAEPVLLADTTPVTGRATDITHPTPAGVLEHVGRITAVAHGLHVAVRGPLLLWRGKNKNFPERGAFIIHSFFCC